MVNRVARFRLGKDFLILLCSLSLLWWYFVVRTLSLTSNTQNGNAPFDFVRVTEFRSICSCRILKKGNAIAIDCASYITAFIYRKTERYLHWKASFSSWFPIFSIASISKCSSRVQEYPFSGWHRVLDPDMTPTHSHHILICISLSSLLLPHRQQHQHQQQHQ